MAGNGLTCTLEIMDETKLWTTTRLHLNEVIGNCINDKTKPGSIEGKKLYSLIKEDRFQTDINTKDK